MIARRWFVLAAVSASYLYPYNARRRADLTEIYALNPSESRKLSIAPEWLLKHTLIMKPVISLNPEVLGGTPVLVGTRVPIANLIDCLESVYSIEEFMDDFPSVRREQVVELLDLIKLKLPQIAA